MPILQRFKLAWLVFLSGGMKPNSIMPEHLIQAWKRTLLLTECREEIMSQFANEAATHCREYLRMRAKNGEIALELQASQEECRQLEEWTSKEFEALCALDPTYRRSTEPWDEESRDWKEGKEREGAPNIPDPEAVLEHLEREKGWKS